MRHMKRPNDILTIQAKAWSFRSEAKCHVALVIAVQERARLSFWIHALPGQPEG